MTENDRVNLLNWFLENQRPLPWRKNRNPYRIWISETMLQQTTTEAVKPYYEKFLTRFPSVHDLAKAPIEDVLEYWAGLGYYSRARNLHKAAQVLSANGFSRTYTKLIELPGFGPYTSRAVSSIAFGEKVGVLDGNVIRVLSRKHNQALEWWRPANRRILQELADAVIGEGPSHQLNQALMELGATICLPRNPKCMLCPWMKTCEARKADTIEALPLKKKQRDSEIWVWKPHIHLKKNKILLVQNNYAPFLKNEWILPGLVIKKSAAPTSFHFRHSITHHDIFVQLQKKPVQYKSTAEKWVDIKQVAKISPFSLMTKALKSIEISG
jgi:A/G-specific adenine glycosylase